MKIKPTLRTCNDLDIDDLQPLNLKTPLARMMSAVVEVMAHHPDLQNLHSILPSEAYPDIQFPDASRLVEVDVHLCAALSDISVTGQQTHLSDPTAKGDGVHLFKWTPLLAF